MMIDATESSVEFDEDKAYVKIDINPKNDVTMVLHGADVVWITSDTTYVLVFQLSEMVNTNIVTEFQNR